MKMGSVSLFGRLCCGLSMAALALAVSLDGSRAVRAEEVDVLTSSMQEMIVDPIMKTIRGLEARLASVEATASTYAESFTSRRLVAQMLCVSDESGAQTCITKAQLDSLLSNGAHAEIIRPSVAATEAKAQPTEEPVETIVTKGPTPASEQAGPAEEKSVPDQAPEHTGTVQQSASSGAAVVLNPEVEVTEKPTATAAKAQPTEEPVETIVTKDPTPASEPAGPAEEKSVPDQAPEHTGTVQQSASSGAAVVLNPEVEVTEEPGPVQSAAKEPAAPSDN